ncbi:DUF2845 domain-containing protein [Colwellia sp. MEBiC06753]
MKFLLLILTLFSTVTLASSRDVQNFKCKKGWVRIGMSSGEIQQRCGKPESITLLSGANQPRLEEHFYQPKRSGSSATYSLTVSLGKVISITENR